LAVANIVNINMCNNICQLYLYTNDGNGFCVLLL